MVTAELKKLFLKKIPKTKHFDGVRFCIKETQLVKSAAKSIARIERKKGNKARVVKVGARYGIYTSCP